MSGNRPDRSPEPHFGLGPAGLAVYNVGMIAAVIQMNTTDDRQANLVQAERLLDSAAAGGAGLAVLPEHFSFMQSEGSLPARPEPLRGPLVSFLADKARTLGLWIVGGSFAQRSRDPEKVYNTCPVLSPEGELVAYYQKMHLFDLNLPGLPGLTESRYVLPGHRLVTLDTPLGILGLSICYDLRFPELYRRLRLKGAQVLTAPSAFTKATGQAHWELLLRARAVENSCFVLAGAQWGQHNPRRESFGQAMIVNPWGDILARCEPGVGLAMAEVNPGKLDEQRRRLDSTRHARLLPAAWGEPDPS